jgi:hypothetical protein
MIDQLRVDHDSIMLSGFLVSYSFQSSYFH